MKSGKRGSLLRTAAALAAGGAAAHALPVRAQTSSLTPFMVPATFLSYAGSSEQFPVRRIYCIGRNYAAHAREMGSDPNREPPFFFTKPADALVPMGGKLSFPIATKDWLYAV